MVQVKLSKLIYSYGENDLAHVELKPEGYVPAGYIVVAEQMDAKDALKFINQMHTKYVKGRVNGRYPSFDVITLELELFLKLKDYRRKLVKR